MAMRPNYNREKWFKYVGLILIFASLIWISQYLIIDVVDVMGKNSGKNLPIYSVETSDKLISISFDAAWGNEDTRNILDILERYNVKATFFLVGKWVEKYPDDVKAIYEAGHDIGNHSSTHPDMSQLSKGQITEELMNTHNKVKALVGIDMELFRLPYGAYNERLIDTARECGYYTIQWDVDSLDWKEYGVDVEINTVLNHKDLKNGSIILFHNNAKFTPDALPAIIEGLQNQGYTLVPISQLIIRDDYKIDHTGRQFPVNDSGKKEVE